MVKLMIVERCLNDIRTELKDLRQSTDITWEAYQTDKRLRRYVERALHVLIEACIDVAQHIIADESFREPINYRDTFVVLGEEGVIPRSQVKNLENMASFRNLIVHYYEKVDDAIVYGILKKNLNDFELFADAIAAYAQNQQSSCSYCRISNRF